MANFIPINDLDRALIAAGRSLSAMPDLYRRLSEGDLCLLIPYQEGLEESAIRIENGAQFPFAMLQDDEGEVVPIYSSTERAEEGLTRSKVAPSTFLLGTMPSQQVMEVLGQMNMRATLNKSCTTPEFTLPPDLMRDIASGEVLEPLPQGATETHVLNLIDPADFPTWLVQPVFEYCRCHREYRAVWVFQSPVIQAKVAASGGEGYHLLFLMDPPDRVIHHDLNLITAAAMADRPDDLSHGLIDATDPVRVADLFRQAQPFYLAADFAKPRTQ
ncbi:MAG: SseB family protein [Chthoniobacterales bacterium]